MGKKGLQNKFASLVQQQLKEEDQTTRELVNLLLAQVDSRRNAQSPAQAIRDRLDKEIQKMIDEGRIDPIDVEDF